MDLQEKIRTLPPVSPSLPLQKCRRRNHLRRQGQELLRSRVRSSYLLEAFPAGQCQNRLAHAREAVDLDYILVDNEREALALENNLIKQRKPRFNILLRDDKTYPYVKLTLGDRYPKVFVTRRLRKDGSAYYGPYFPGNLAHRIVDLIHRSFLSPLGLQDRPVALPRTPLSAVLHQALPRPLRGKSHHSRDLPRSRPRRADVFGRPSSRTRPLHRTAHE